MLESRRNKPHHHGMQTASAHADSPIIQRATALAAMCQCIFLVDRIARKGEADEADFRACIESIFAEGGSASRIYRHAAGFGTGIRTAKRLLAGPAHTEDRLLMTYLAGLLTLEKRLKKRADLRAALSDGMARIARQRQYFNDALHPSVIAAIAALYGETISTMTPRIIVRGKADHMRQEANRQRVRALLMAGLRGAHLWRGHGGGFFGFLLRRKPLLHALAAIEQCAESVSTRHM